MLGAVLGESASVTVRPRAMRDGVDAELAITHGSKHIQTQMWLPLV